MLNKCQFIGNLGDAPDVRVMQNGDKVVNLSLAVTEKWKNKDGERQSKTEWIKVVVFNKGLINVCENYLKKGSKIYLEGSIETRKYEKDGQTKYTTEIVLRPYKSVIVMLDSKPQGQQQQSFDHQENTAAQDDWDNQEIPY